MKVDVDSERKLILNEIALVACVRVSERLSQFFILKNFFFRLRAVVLY
jgi:hypothetical protein